MFKKTLLCAALVAVSGGALAKAVGAATEIVHGTEGAVGAISVTSAAVTYTLGASYTQGDTITLTWSQALAAGVGHTALSITDGTRVIPLTVLSNTTSSVTYRAGAVPASYNYGATQTLVTAAKNLLGSGQANGTLVTQQFTAATSNGIEIDAGSVATQVAGFFDQYAVTVTTKANALIDVENARKQFSSPSPASHAINEDAIVVATSTAATYTTAVSGGTAGLTANLSGGATNTFTFKGDFSWMDTAAAGFAIDATLGSLSATAGGGDLTASAGVTSLAAGAVMQSSTGAAPGASLFIGTEKKTALTAKTYTVDVVLNYNNGAARSKTFTALAAGSWGLNGATITAYGIPNQASITPFLWVQNAGTTAGEISGTVSCDGVTTSLGALGSAAGDTNTRVGPAVQAVVDGLTTCGVGSRYDVTLTVNAKSTDVSVNAGYRVTAADGSNDRLSLETSDSLN